MKRIAIIGSGRGDNFEAIVKYFSEKNVEITCLSDNINSDILICAKKLGIKNKYLPFEENAEYFGARNFDLIVLCEYAQNLPDDVLELGKFINIHPSLLPAFKGKDAISRSYMSGVKVSGVTVHWVTDELDGGKIIAQYPILIPNLMHFDEFESEIYKLEDILYPKVIECILEDKVFDFADLIVSTCNSTCSGKCSENDNGGCGCH